jgi:predicted transcriptional regulator
MSKSLVELSADILTAQARHTTLLANEMAASLRTIFRTLQDIQREGGSAAGDVAVSPNPETSIQRSQVICLECHKAFKLLSNRHLALHQLTPRAYKHKHGIRMTQALSARTLSTKRRKLAKALGMGTQLAAWRSARKQQTLARAAVG